MAANATDFNPYSATVTLTGSDAAVLNTTGNYADTGTNVLNLAGASYLHATGDVYICPNTAGSLVYRVSGLASGDTGAVTALTGSGLLTTSTNGTYGRFKVFQRASTTLAVRVSGLGNPIEIMRVV